MTSVSPGKVFAAATLFLKQSLGESLLCVLLTSLEEALTARHYGFIAVTDGSFSERSRRHVAECELDFFVIPYGDLSDAFRTHGDPHLLWMLSDAKPLYDTAGLSDSIVGRAQGLLQRPRCYELTVELIAKPVDIYRDVLKTHLVEPAGAQLLATAFVHSSLELLLVRRRKWPRATKHLLADVECCDAASANLARSVLSAGSWPERISAMGALYERCAGRKIDEPTNVSDRRMVRRIGAASMRVTPRRVDLAV